MDRNSRSFQTAGTLQQWQQPKPSSKRWLWHTCIALTCAFTLSYFLFQIASPYQQARLEIVTLGPAPGAHSSELDPFSAAPSEDLTQFLSSVDPHQELHRSLQGLSEKTIPSLRQLVEQSSREKSTLLVMASGTLIASRQKLLLTSYYLGSDSQTGCDLVGLVHELAKCEFREVLLCVEYSTDEHSVIGAAKRPITTQAIRATLESALRHSRLPMAVLLVPCKNHHASATDAALDVSESHFTQALRAILAPTSPKTAPRSLQISDLQLALSPKDSTAGRQWIVSSNWATESSIARATTTRNTTTLLPKLNQQSNPQQGTATASSSSNTVVPPGRLVSFSRSAANSDLPEAVKRQIDELSKWSAEQRLKYCVDVRDQIRANTFTYSRDRRHPPCLNPISSPNAWYHLEAYLASASNLPKHSEESSESLLQLAETLTLLSMDELPSAQRGQLAAWLQRVLPPAPHDLNSRPAFYLTLQNTLPASDLLATLLSQTNGRVDETQALAWITQLPPEQANFYEIEFAKQILPCKRIPWELRQQIVARALKLLSLEFNQQVAAILAKDIKRAKQNLFGGIRLLSRRTNPSELQQGKHSVALAAQLIDDLEVYAVAAEKSHVVRCQTMAEIIDWSAIITPSGDRDPNNDPICRQIRLVEFLNRTLDNGLLADTETIERITTELVTLRANWVETIASQTKLQDPGQSAAWDVTAYQRSLLPKSITRSGFSSTQGSFAAMHNEDARSLFQMQVERLDGIVRLLFDLSEPQEWRQVRDAARQQLLDRQLSVAEMHSVTMDIEHAFRSACESAVAKTLTTDTISTAEWKVAAPAMINTLHLTNLDESLQNLRNAGWQSIARVYCLEQSQWLDQSSQEEEQLIHRELDSWSTGIGITTQIDKFPIEITLPANLDFSVHSRLRVPIVMVNRSEQVQQVAIQLTFDSHQVDCYLSDQANSTSSTNTPDKILETTLGPGMNISRLVDIQQSDISAETPSPLVLSVYAGEASRVRVVELVSATSAIAGARFTNALGRESGLQHIDLNQANIAEIDTNTVLFANEQAAIAVQLLNKQTSPDTFAVRLLLPQDNSSNVPMGSLPSAVADNWIAGHRCSVLASVPAPIAVLGMGSAHVKFPPQALVPTEPTRSVAELVLEVKSLSRDLTQLMRFVPRIVRPSSYVTPIIRYDSTERVVRVSLELAPPSQFKGHETRVAIFLQNAKSGEIVGHGRTELNADQPFTNLAVPMNSTDHHEFVLRIEVDDWPNSFVALVDPNRTVYELPFATIPHSVRARALSATTAVTGQVSRLVHDATESEIACEVDLVVSDGAFDPSKATLEIGLDVNRDRTLMGEPTTVLRQAVQTQVVWKGCDAQGRILLDCQVTRPRVALPVSMNWDQVVDVLAHYRMADQDLWSQSIPVIVDHQAPKVIATYVSEPQPGLNSAVGLLGPPAKIEVVVDDFGLSDVGSVQGAWSLTGQTILSPELKPVPAVRLESGNWMLTLPTDQLNSGKSMLLVSCTDRSGNSSETHISFHTFLTPEQLEQERAKVTTLVHGRVLFGPQALSDFEITLTPITEKATKDTLKPQLAAKSNTSGQFVIESVPSGVYRLSATGLVRGVRHTRSLDVKVDAPQVPKAVTLRFDKPTKTSDSK